MEFLDWLVVAIYFAATLGIAAYAALQRHAGNEDDYFLAGRNVGWFVIGASIFASNIGSEHLIGLAGSGASGGVAVAQFEILAGLILLLLGWLFVPFYLASGVFTMPEFLQKRYSEGPRLYLAILSIVGYILTKISVTVAAGGIVFEVLMGINFWTGALIIVVITGVYTVVGGLRVVLYTDVLQMFVLIGGAVSVTIIGLGSVGGWEGMVSSVSAESMSLWRDVSHPEFPWTGILFGAPILAVWYWCTDQFIVQRVLSASSSSDARKATILAAYLKQLPLFIFVLPGVIAMAMVSRGQLVLEEPDQALPTMVMTLLPVGLKGLVAAGLLAALMSSLSSVFNSSSTIFTMDIYRRFDPNADSHRLVVVGQIATAVIVALALLWIPFMDLISGQLFTYVQSVQAYIAPPIAAVFLGGILWKRANASGAIGSLVVGSGLGLGRLILEINQSSLSGTLLWLAEINFLHAAIMLFIASVTTLVIVSLLTAPPDEASVKGLTLSDRAPSDASVDRKRDAVLSLGVVVVILAIWFTFS